MESSLVSWGKGEKPVEKITLWPERIVLTARDIELFQYLNEQKFMVSGQIYEIFWPKSDPESGTARQRLTKLVESGYLKIIQIERNKLRLFLLREKGIEALRQRRLDHGFSELSDVNPVLVEHGLKLVNIRSLFRELGQRNWRSERVIRKADSNRGWYPDGILDVSGFKIAIELENSFREKDRYIRRFKHYAETGEFALVIFILSWPSVRSWIYDLDAPQDKIAFVDYDALLEKKGDAELGNKTSKITLRSILL